MKYYNTEQTINLFQNLPDSLKPFDLPQIADLCRQGILTPVFAYNSYGIEVLEYYDGNKPLIYINGVDTEPDTSRFPDPRTTYLYDDYFTHDRLTSLLDKSIDNLEIHNAMIYKSDGSGYEVVLVANPLNINKYLNDENYSVYSDNDGFTVTRESLLFPSEQVQKYIASKQTAKQNTPEQQRIAELESQIAELQEQLRQQSIKLPNDPLLTTIHNKNYEYHAPDLSHAIKLWSELYIDGLIGSDSHSNKSNKWIQQNTSYGDNTEDSSVKRLRQVSTPLKDFGGQRKR